MAEHYARVVLARSRTLRRAEIYAELARDLRALQRHPAAGRANLETTSVAAGTRSEREILDPARPQAPLAALAMAVELRRVTSNAFEATPCCDNLEGSVERARVCRMTRSSAG